MSKRDRTSRVMVAAGITPTPLNIRNVSLDPDSAVVEAGIGYWRVRIGPGRRYWHADLGAPMPSAGGASVYQYPEFARLSRAQLGRHARVARVLVVPHSDLPCVVDLYWRVRVHLLTDKDPVGLPAELAGPPTTRSYPGWWSTSLGFVRDRWAASGAARLRDAFSMLRDARKKLGPGCAVSLVRVRVYASKPEPGVCPHCGGEPPHNAYPLTDQHHPFYVCRGCGRSFDREVHP